MLLGQWLNVSVYRALGAEGVYYGARFGKAVPWVRGWPYTASTGLVDVPIRDPQYWGCILCLAGTSFFVRAPLARAALVFWAVNYLALMWIESFSVDEPTSSADVKQRAKEGRKRS